MAGEIQPRQAASQFNSDIVDGQETAGASRPFDFEVVSVVVMELLEGLDDEEVQREPDGAAPIRIAAEDT